MGNIGPIRHIDFGNQPWQTTNRPDITVLKAIDHSLIQQKSIRPLLRYRLNNSLYEGAGQYRFSELKGTALKSRIILSSINSTPDLNILVNYLRQQGEATYSNLINLYGSEFQSEVTPYIDRLIDDQFLVSNLSIPITGVDMTSYLLNQIGYFPSEISRHKQLLVAQNALSQGIAQLADLCHVQCLLDQTVHSAETPVEPVDSRIQTDLFFHPKKLILDESTTLQIANQFSQVIPILTNNLLSPLQEFIQRFQERYDKQAIDLLTALDPELGVGFASDKLADYPLLSELPFPVQPTALTATDQFEHLREVLYSRFLLHRQKEIEITEADINAVTKISPVSPLPPAWYLHGELFMPNSSSGELNSLTEEKWRFVLNSTIGTSSAFFLGRFCHGHEPLRAAVESMCAWEQMQYPTEILAEIVHLPVSPLRAGNVVARPILRPYEIPYLTSAGVDTDHTIFLADLLVSVTAEGEVILRHKRTGQRVRPRLSTAHNPSLGDEVYQFLASVYQAESNTWSWSWRSLSQLPALPRLVYGNLIISPAQWTIRKDLLPADHLLTGDLLRTLYDLPRYVQFVEGDNKLLLDLEFEPAWRILVDEVKKQEKIRLKEWLGETHSPWLISATNQHVSELIIPMRTLAHSEQSVASLRPSAPFIPGQTSYRERTFTPGQDWLYLKVYLHEQIADQILQEVLTPLYKQALKKGWSIGMFFIRYADPEHHLRIRFQTNNKYYAKLLMTWHQAIQPYVALNLVKHIQVDTYQRELERYHPELIESCETIFSADSQFFLKWLSQINEPQDEDRYSLALASVDALLTDFRFSLTEKAKFSLHLQNAFFQEHGGSKALKQQLNRLFRNYNKCFFESSLTTKRFILERRDSIQTEANLINAYFAQNSANRGHDQLIASLLHMALNRIFTGQNRKHELIVYHFLARSYQSQLARLKQSPD
ncbi:hypothetical protein GCM10028808_57080 [Spirosoma migulaei]